MKNKVLLIYTELGFAGSYLVQAPISLVYVSTQIQHIPGLEIEIIDCRVQKDWRAIIGKRIKEERILMVGFFVMSGLQVAKAFEATEVVKSCDPDVPVVWGGPHPTILPEDVLNYDNVEFCVRGFGTDAFTELTQKLLAGKKDFETIPNLCFKKGGENVIGEINSSYERIHYKDLPYDLLDPLIENYFQNKSKREFPIYTAFGCPYQCNFCISPIWFEDTNKKWDPLPMDEVVGHMEYLIDRYDINFFYLWDDDSFVRPSHFTNIAKEILRRKLNIQIGVRGIRSNEVERMNKEDLDLLDAVGVKYLHIGVENGSQRMLDLMKKGISIEQSLSANRKLAEHDKITPMYNMLCGIPTETREDLKETGLFMLKMMKDNPNGIIYAPNKLVPYPGGEAYDIAIKHGYIPPNSPQDWINVDQEGEVYQPWYTPDHNRHIRALQMATYAISNWEKFLENYPLPLRIFYKIAKSLYLPIARFRLKTAFTGFLIEYPLMLLAKRVMMKGVTL